MKDIAKAILILILNLFLAGSLAFAWMVTAFQLGWADTGDHSTETGMLYCGFVIFHLTLNLFLIIQSKKGNLSIIIISCLFILILYVLIYTFTYEISLYIDENISIYL